MDIACLVIFLVCIFYTSVGGMKAVMWTDTFQVRTPQSLRLAGVRVPHGYSLPVHLPSVHLLHLGRKDEGGHVDRHLLGKDTTESLTRWCQSSPWMSEFPVNIVCPVIFLLCIICTSAGGIKVVMWIDIFQVRALRSL